MVVRKQHAKLELEGGPETTGGTHNKKKKKKGTQRGLKKKRGGNTVRDTKRTGRGDTNKKENL